MCRPLKVPPGAGRPPPRYATAAVTLGSSEDARFNSSKQCKISYLEPCLNNPPSEIEGGYLIFMFEEII